MCTQLLIIYGLVPNLQYTYVIESSSITMITCASKSERNIFGYTYMSVSAIQ